MLKQAKNRPASAGDVLMGRSAHSPSRPSTERSGARGRLSPRQQSSSSSKSHLHPHAPSDHSDTEERGRPAPHYHFEEGTTAADQNLSTTTLAIMNNGIEVSYTRHAADGWTLHSSVFISRSPKHLSRSRRACRCRSPRRSTCPCASRRSCPTPSRWTTRSSTCSSRTATTTTSPTGRPGPAPRLAAGPLKKERRRNLPRPLQAKPWRRTSSTIAQWSERGRCLRSSSGRWRRPTRSSKCTTDTPTTAACR